MQYNLRTMESIYPPFPINIEVLSHEFARHYCGHWFHPWSGKVPHALPQLSLCTTTAEATCRNHWAHVLQPLKPADPRARALQREATAMRNPHTTTREQSPLAATKESPCTTTKT